jgi:hypothetical protein
MKTLCYCESTGRIYWSTAEDSCYIEPVYDGDDLAFWDVWYVPQYGGEPILDSHIDNFSEAVMQLEIVSI